MNEERSSQKTPLPSPSGRCRPRYPLPLRTHVQQPAVCCGAVSPGLRYLHGISHAGDLRRPYPDRVIIAGRREHALTRVPRNRIDCTRMSWKHLEKSATVPVPDVHLRILTAADHKILIGAAERGPDDESALLVPTIP